jgi:hypothetical protein
MKNTTTLLVLLGCVFLVLLGLAFACAGGGDDGSESLGDDDDDDTADDDTPDDDDDDDATPPLPGDGTPSFNFGVVHFHYYGDLGGFDGNVFADDQAWAARHVELGIIGQTDEGSRRAWEEIRSNQPQGRWLNWTVAHLFNTFETAGDCGAPEHGAVDQYYVELSQLFAAFLADRPEHGDGEDCFLHARLDGTLEARWHAAECTVYLPQLGLEGGATDRKQARLQTLVWDEYTWLLDLSGQCAADFVAWRVATDIAVKGFTGAGFDNLGGPLEDMFYLPSNVASVDVIEIDDEVEASPDRLNQWWFTAQDTFLQSVADQVRAANPEAVIVFNGADYCSWDATTERLLQSAGDGIGVWCENALHHPSWGNQTTPDRLETLLALSTGLADVGGFLALETMYEGGSADPIAHEAMYYLAAFLTFAHSDDALVFKPSWNPYAPLADVTWFDFFSRNLGEPTAAATAHGDGIFSRPFARDNGQRALVVARVDTENPAIDFPLAADYCLISEFNGLLPVTGTVGIASGDGLLLIENGTGGVDCQL